MFFSNPSLLFIAAVSIATSGLVLGSPVPSPDAIISGPKSYEAATGNNIAAGYQAPPPEVHVVPRTSKNGATNTGSHNSGKDGKGSNTKDNTGGKANTCDKSSTE
ncbi:uncharacterized protein K452DRAFT_165643 [Aplosporella prunicola CBS 121167]|uniref:Uncharacterized protein n=1 Tax=Aplosporella prunicola CBS 121167 TaxID=1176127 RepID=A0A6A6AX16_9PEZI|nr:uncharacterized protein K452DRAFT_165643 [Aplosporella prunicola CBS 121167]KAF2135713.1 hypothetical protein K452DRAFT_165643 [Aplosporella prunicola CBS 121167]